MRASRQQRTRLLGAAILAASLTLFACGSEDEPEAAADAGETVEEDEDAAGEDEDAAGEELEHSLPANMEMGTSAVGGAFYASGSAMAPVMERELGAAITPTVTEGSGENIGLLANGEIDMAIVTIGTVATAFEGEGGFDREYTELRSLGYLWTHPQVWIALADAPYDSLSEMQDARLAVGPGPTTWDPLTRPILEAHGLDFESLDRVYAGFNDMFASVGDGRVDAAITLLTGGAALMPAAEELAFQQDVKYLTMDPDSIAQAVADTPWYFEMEIDSSLLPGFEGDSYETFDQGGVFMLVLDEMSDENAYALTAAMHASVIAASEDVPFLRAAAEDPSIMMASFDGTPFHPGAEQYWRDAGIWPED